MAFDSVIRHVTMLGNILHRKRCYGMTECNQSWFGNIWVQSHEVLINEIWQKKFKMGPQTFEHDLLNMVCPGIEKIIA